MTGVAKDQSPAKGEGPSPASSPVNTGDQAVATSERNEESRQVLAPHLVVVSPNADNAGRIGPRLRAAREAMSLSIEDAAKDTRISKAYLHALEEMNATRLPGPAYLKGYLRTYAQTVGLDPEMVVERYTAECGALADPVKTSYTPPNASGARLAAPMLIVMAITLLVGGIWFFAPWKGSGQAAAAPALAAASLPNDALSRPTLGVATRVPNLSLIASRRAWMEVRGADGTVFLSRELAPGEVYAPRVGHGWTVTTSDGGAFEWRADGKSLGPVAGDNEPVYSARVDAALERAMEAAE
ncbi:MAG: RodZ domain-containing protein [Pseudomonadota bacterium]